MRKFLKKLFKVLLTVLVVLAVLAGAAYATYDLAYRHRSDPKDVKHYETSNPHIAAERTFISAHRSGGGIAPEETMMALKNCVESKDFSVEYFEFDLQMTKDDVLVLLHDSKLDRTSDSEFVIGRPDVRAEECTFEELRKLNMGAQFEDENGNKPFKDLHGDAVPDDLRIASLDMVLDYLETIAPFRYIIEIKNGGDLGKKGVDILYASVKERGMLGRVAFGTFKKEVSDYKDEKYPDLIRGAYQSEVIDFYLAALLNKKNFEPKYGVLQLPFHNEGSDKHINLGTATVLNYAHAHDLAVQYWTVNDEADIEYLIRLGADCIMTDYPDRAFKILKEVQAEK